MKQWMRVAVMVGVGLCGAVAWAGGVDHGIDTPMLVDPGVTGTARVKVFDPRLKELWSAALDRAEPEMRMNALDAVVQAKLQGMTGLEGLAGKIQALVGDDKQPVAIHAAAIRALDALGAMAYGPAILARAEKGSPELMMVADPVLAKWKLYEAGMMWIDRVKKGTGGGTGGGAADQAVASAMQAMGETMTPGGMDVLKAVVADKRRPIALRLTAAKAISKYPTGRPEDDLGDFADAFVVGKSAEDRLLAAAMLPVSVGIENGPVARALYRLAGDAEPAVAAMAAKKLWDDKPWVLRTLAVKLAANADISVRRIAVDVLFLSVCFGGGEPVAVLGKLLDDDSPAVRAAAREALIDLDMKAELPREPQTAALLRVAEWRPAVRAAAKTALMAGRHAQEQGCLIVGTLHENSARDRLVQLLESPDAPVRLAAVIGLRRLATGDHPVTDTLAVQYDRAKAVFATSHDPAKTKTWTAKAYIANNIELSQLLQNLGLQRYAEADGFMRKFVPKGAPAGVEARMGAIWALGGLHEGKVDAGLSRELAGRVADNNLLNPEAVEVRAMSAIALGRMRDKGAKGTLTRVAGEEAGNVIGESCLWAIAQIDGVAYKPSSALPNPVKGWFLEPND